MSDKSTLPKLKLKESPNIDAKTRLDWEKELLGLYVSGHPLDKYKEIIQKKDIDIKKIKEKNKEKDIVTIACVIEEIKPIITKEGGQMLFIRLADFSGAIESVVFPRTLIEFKDLFKIDNCIAVRAKVSERKGEKSLIVERVKGLV